MRWPRHTRRLFVSLLVGVTLVAVGQTAAQPTPPPANETRTVDARDPDPCLTPAAYNATYGAPPTPTQQLATCTDLTYAAPPAHAAALTADAFAALTPGNATTAVAPPGATRTTRGLIADAHATLFAVHPATQIHLSPTESRQYIAPNGTVRALIDYRVRAPTGNRSVIRYRVREVRVSIGDEQVGSASGSQTPTIRYSTTQARHQPLTVTAEITVTVAPNGTAGNVTTQTVAVSDTHSVWIYRLRPTAYTATYPDGDTGLAVYQGTPWHGVTLTRNGSQRVRGVWRYYTTRAPRWDRVEVRRASGTTQRAPAGQPIGVVAFPARIGPRADPVREGPQLTAVWGVSRSPPASRLGSNVSVGLVREAYTRTYGLALRNETVTPETARVHGIVRGVSAPLSAAPRSERAIRRPNLSVQVVATSPSTATIRIALHDPQTGDPIDLTGSQPPSPVGDDGPAGTLRLNDEPVALNYSGVTTVTVSDPGLYTVTFEPASWRTTTPAYVAASESVRWHPLGTVGGWVHLLETAIWGSIPVVVAWVAGRRIGQYLRTEPRQ
ncbi:hypothetical protein HPS36_04095 [Halorubrum salinarum]|uniref:Secreted glycoprotein n=1 Tax=Halorubrum salinarum TaxID=2739057 RepID=A0A7D3XUF4_9EURY|nr:hypothetical protein HPS36_04095 [Halorubrum salinarum]